MLLQLLLTCLYKNKKYAASPINNTPFLVISVKVIICNYKCQSVLVIIHNLLAYLQFPITPRIQKSHHLSSSWSWAPLILLRGWLLQNIDNINESFFLPALLYVSDDCSNRKQRSCFSANWLMLSIKILNILLLFHARLLGPLVKKKKAHSEHHILSMLHQGYMVLQVEAMSFLSPKHSYVQ